MRQCTLALVLYNKTHANECVLYNLIMSSYKNFIFIYCDWNFEILSVKIMLSFLFHLVNRKKNTLDVLHTVDGVKTTRMKNKICKILHLRIGGEFFPLALSVRRDAHVNEAGWVIASHAQICHPLQPVSSPLFDIVFLLHMLNFPQQLFLFTSSETLVLHWN